MTQPRPLTMMGRRGTPLSTPLSTPLRVSNQQETWKMLGPGLREKFYYKLPLYVTRYQAQAEGKRAGLQAEVERSWEHHECTSGPAHSGQFTRESDGEVTYYGMDSVFQLSLPKWTCTCCSNTFTPHALDYGCFPSTPTTPHVWYDLQVLRLYRKPGLSEGLSATGKGILCGFSN